MPLYNIKIDGIEIETQSGQTILDAAKSVGIYIPTLCSDERVAMYASCGICLVEAENTPKLLRACSTLVSAGMVIKTNTDRVKTARKFALELLLSNHTGDCRPPCVLACPAQTDCQGYVGLIANGEYEAAASLIKENLPLPSSIGRVCPHPCEKECRRKLVEQPVSIASLKYFASDKFIDETKILPEAAADTGKTAAIIGGGPGGLSAAYFLRLKGHAVTVFDAMPKMGGMLRYGIPEYRLPKDILDKEISVIEKMGVKLVNNCLLSESAGENNITLDYLRQNYDAVIIAIGAWSSMKLNCPGEDLRRVYGGIDFLRGAAQNSAPFIGKTVAVVGGGNTAMDTCRSAVRLGAEKVYNIYRRTKNEMPAEDIEIQEAEEEGVIFKYLTNPIEILPDEAGAVSKVRLQKMALGNPDASGRRSPVPVAGEEEVLDVDSVIIAIGQGVKTAGLEDVALTKRGTVSADEATFRTNLKGVFAIGDATNKGADIAISAIGEARGAALVIDGFLNGGMDVSYTAPFLVKTEKTERDFAETEKIPRTKMRHLEPQQRKTCFSEVNLGFSEEEAVNEAKRCLECGCSDFFECKLYDIANMVGASPDKYSGEKTATGNSGQNDELIIRNPDKCILCGLCVRVCDEVMGVCALGLTGRGFDVTVKPAFDLDLSAAGCTLCGQCAALCPTGAITEKTAAQKQVPVKEEFVNTVCPFCSVGCKTKLTFKGNMVLRNLPDNSENKTQILCEKGRFGFNDFRLWENRRIVKAAIKNESADLSFALNYAAEKMAEIIKNCGTDAAAVTVSGKSTNEEIQYAKNYAENFGVKVYSFDRKESALSAVTGKDASNRTFNDILSADVILLAARDIMKSHPVVGIQIRKAVLNGAKLILAAGSTPSLADEWSDKRFGLDEIGNAIKEYGTYKTEKSIIVFAQDDISYDAQTLLANAAISAEHGGGTTGGIIQLKKNANDQGLADAGIGYANELTEKIKNGTIRALTAFGECLSGADSPEENSSGAQLPEENLSGADSPSETFGGFACGANLSGLEFLCVSAAYMEADGFKTADVVLPCAGFARQSGTYTNTVGEKQKVALI
ncbi:MAG: FAD-dependent oxidoreductase [Clostridiales bacterium]|jgi:formate dehydrogenase major subunit|nr:FAD-dependent oxidoreductase [Clostridiales bacterium]